MALRIGTETASLINHIHSRATLGQPDPVVGMGVTFLSWTDRSAGTIQSVKDLTSQVWQWEIEVTRDSERLVGGSCMSEEQEYEFTQHPDAKRIVYRCRRDGGEWVRHVLNENGRLVINRGNGLRIGQRDAYRDPCF